MGLGLGLGLELGLGFRVKVRKAVKSTLLHTAGRVMCYVMDHITAVLSQLLFDSSLWENHFACGLGFRV